jgi:hypothetical protein
MAGAPCAVSGTFVWLVAVCAIPHFCYLKEPALSCMKAQNVLPKFTRGEKQNVLVSERRWRLYVCIVSRDCK